MLCHSYEVEVFEYLKSWIVIEHCFEDFPIRLINSLYQLFHVLCSYGLQLCTNVRTTDSESKNCNMKAVQVAQNKLLRLLLDIPSNDRTSTSELLAKTGLLSVNQLAVSIKMLEAWKSENLNNYPVQLEPNSTGQSVSDRVVRPSTSRKWNQDTKFSAAKECFSRNTAKIWNSAPTNIRTTKNINCAKNEIKKYCKTLPIWITDDWITRKILVSFKQMAWIRWVQRTTQMETTNFCYFWWYFDDINFNYD